MSSSEEYLDSLLDSILSGGKSEGEENSAAEESLTTLTENKPTDGGKAMSSDEIEEMLVSMGTLGGGEDAQEQSSEEDMEAMLAFMNEHNADNAEADASDNLAIDEMPLSDPDVGEGETEDSALDDLSLDDLSLEETDDGASDTLDGLSLDDPDMGESGTEDSVLDDLSLDDLSLDDLSLEETDDGASDTLDSLSLDDSDMGESGTEDSALDDLALDDLSLEETDDGASDTLDGLALDDLALEETDDGASDTLDGLSLDDLDMGESESDDSAPDDLSLDDLSLEEMDDGASDTLDGLSLDDLDMGENESDDSVMDELSLDDLSSEEPENTEEDADGLMSEEDIDRLLNGDMSEETGNDFALEESGEVEDDDLSALLAGMGHDEELSEINDLLEESDQGVSADDDMLAMLEGADEGSDSSFDLFESDEAAREAESIRELSPEEAAQREGGSQGKKEKKKKKKLFGRKKKGNEEELPDGEAGDELEALLGEVSADQGTAKEEKKPGFFARLLDFLLESDEDEDPVAAEVLAGNEGETGTVTDENKELLQELSDEDKKGKKKKKKKDKKGKKGKDGEEDDKKAKKEKKPKKVKKKKEKPKKDEEVDLFAPPEKKLSKKKVMTAFLFAATIMAGIIVFTTILPDTMQRRDAQTAYDQGSYADVYNLLYGKELNEQEEVLFQGSNLVLQMERKLSSYDNYVNLNMRPEALNALLVGVERYKRILPEAENYNVAAEVNDIYAQILDRLAAFGLSEQDALDLLSVADDVEYTLRLNAIVNGESYGEEEAVEPGIQDMLPEEEEIMERIGGADGETEIEVEFEPEDISTEEEMPEEEMPEDQTADEISGEGAE